MASWIAPLLNRRMLICVFTGFASGLPLYLLLNLLPAWLKTEGISLKAIGLLALIQLPYTWKFLWSPLLDRFALPGFGRRRGWMLLTQISLLLAIGLLGGQSVQGMVAPSDWASALSFATHPVALLALAVALFSATQDIALDAFRREILAEDELGLGNSVHVNAYRIAGLIPGSLSLILADHLPWSQVFWITAAFMLPGMIMTLLVNEPQSAKAAPRTLHDAVVLPFREFMGRAGWRSALLILAFIFLYKLGDSLCTALATPFYLDMGYSKSEIGIIAKNAGLWPAVIGGLIGGLWMVRLGINRALWLFGLVQIITILGFVWLAWIGQQTVIGTEQLLALALVIGSEALGVGLGTAAFVAFIASNTNPAYTATQFALFTSLAAVPRTFINASAGWLVENLGWTNFFLLCFVLAVPGMVLLLKVAPWKGKPATLL
jgi:PAT family beta-lactamase induction signal transducer AmpG